jgi:hypothetical protein
MNKIKVEASYPAPGRLNIVFKPPLQTWRFPGYARENDGRRAALDACRDAVRQRSADAEPPPGEIETAVEAALATLVENGSITLP